VQTLHIQPLHIPVYTTSPKHLIGHAQHIVVFLHGYCGMKQFTTKGLIWNSCESIEKNWKPLLLTMNLDALNKANESSSYNVLSKMMY
jgi:hypothetical protein